MLYRVFAAACIIVASAHTPALGCAAPRPFDIREVETADIVAEGTVTQYRAIDALTAELQFNVTKYLYGSGPKEISAYWFILNYHVPDNLPKGPWLIAFRSSGSKWTVLHPGCGAEFMFEATSDRANSVRQILAQR